MMEKGRKNPMTINITNFIQQKFIVTETTQQPLIRKRGATQNSGDLYVIMAYFKKSKPIGLKTKIFEESYC